jgi:L-aminopeptidase/D-esterase-like protein
MKMNGTITDVPGIKVGHAQDLEAVTGCTVVICEKGGVAGVDQRGGAPGTRETDAIRPLHLVNKIQAILLAGGSAFGLDAATGVMKYLEEKGLGFDTGVARVPVVPAAILFDLAIGKASVRPDAYMGYQACLNASERPVPQGCVGAGTGATAGNALGPKQSTKSGIGSASLEIGGGVVIGALIAVNPFGDVYDPETGKIIAGTRSIHKGLINMGDEPIFANTKSFLKTTIGKTVVSFASSHNTVIGVVATNARLDREETNFLAQMAQDGLPLAIRPAHTLFDGDTLFAISTGIAHVDVNIIGTFAVEVVSRAIVNAVQNAITLAGIPSSHDLLNTIV